MTGWFPDKEWSSQRNKVAAKIIRSVTSWMMVEIHDNYNKKR